MTSGYKVMIKLKTASDHLGFGKYNGLMSGPQKLIYYLLVYLCVKFHACRQICTILPKNPLGQGLKINKLSVLPTLSTG